MSDVVRRRVAAVLLVLAIAIAALAITDTGPFDDPPTEEERAQAAVEEFFAAAAEGDSKTFCGLLTKQAREMLRVNTAQQLRTDELPGCGEILDALAELFKGSTVSVRFVNVSGNRARAETRYKLAGAGAQPRTVLLLSEDGEWHISDPDG